MKKTFVILLLLVSWAGPAQAGEWVGLPVDGWIPDLSLSIHGGWVRFHEGEMVNAGLQNGFQALLEASWN